MSFLLFCSRASQCNFSWQFLCRKAIQLAVLFYLNALLNSSIFFHFCAFLILGLNVNLHLHWCICLFKSGLKASLLMRLYPHYSLLSYAKADLFRKSFSDAFLLSVSLSAKQISVIQTVTWVFILDKIQE